MFFFIFLWVACAIICAITANTKNRSVVGWLVLGLLFGVVPVIIILCLPSTRASMADMLAAQKLVEMANERPGSVDTAVLSQAQRTLSSSK
jgi:hypothetical protein